MKEPRLCLSCCQFPCLCGDQYKTLSDNQYNTLLKNLSKLRDNVVVTRDGKNIINIVKDVPEGSVSLFSFDEVESMPKSWQAFFNKNLTTTAQRLVKIITEKSIDELSFPSGLILAILIKSRLPQKKYAEVIYNWLKSRNDALCTPIASLIDTSATYLDTTIDNISRFVVNFNSIPIETLDELGKMCKNSASILNTTLRYIRDENAELASVSFARFMQSLVTYSTDSQISETDHRWCIPEYNNDIVYIDESFREYASDEDFDLPELVPFVPKNN